ncbi:MAG TPA: hypothetical protein VEB86_08050 [Chryseosolibacter sp.]|nr:hypothetical protein [Chryseosolibacter sp.]
MTAYRWLKVAMIAVVIASCGKPLPELDGFDKVKFAEDRNGCLGKRLLMTDALRRQKDKLLALDEMKIVAVLGKPDHNELYKRNQKFYHYYLSPSADCAAADTGSLKLVIRFNAMGLAKEVAVE